MCVATSLIYLVIPLLHISGYVFFTQMCLDYMPLYVALSAGYIAFRYCVHMEMQFQSVSEHEIRMRTLMNTLKMLISVLRHVFVALICLEYMPTHVALVIIYLASFQDTQDSQSSPEGLDAEKIRKRVIEKWHLDKEQQSE